MRRNKLQEKALIIQSLFFCFISTFAQSDLTLKPDAGAFLEESQAFEVTFSGEAPTLVRVFLNDGVIRELDKPPWVFQLSLDTSLANTIRVVAEFENGRTAEIQRTYAPPQTDEASKVDAFQIFPFLDLPYQAQELEFESGRTEIKPERFESADAFNIEIMICLDVSGSMRWTLDEIKPHLLKTLKFLEERQAKINVIVFDQNPRLLRYQQLEGLELWEALYQGSAKSAVWDTVATATGFFRDSPRRMIFLISDGMDSGSRHNEDTAMPFVRETGAAIIWMNPFNQTPSKILDLTKDSGGFMIRGTDEEAWALFIERLQYQMWLLAPSAKFPIDLDIDDRDVWFPRWDD